MLQRVFEIINYRDMIGGMIKREIRGRYKGSMLGFAWNVITPMCQIVIYYIVFSMVFRSGIENFHVYLVVGMMPWTCFSDAIVQGTGSIVANADMTKKIYFPREVLPISIVTSRFINLLLTFIVVFLIIFFSSVNITPSLLLFLPLILVVEYVLTLAIVILLSAFNVYYHDVEYISGVIMMLLVWMTPIMYSLDSVGNGILLKLVMLNPMTTIIDAYHQILFYGAVPNLLSLGLVGIFAVVFLLIAELVFMTLEKRFAEVL